ncbi:MAG: hypothetical protein HOF91_08265 [Rhodospirillaceae bacterium]|jgi:hypothetical protein|nr:hypothetical protein [Rhodospirillaceae bacterium]MBT6258685.1 hypothetical protein [Rhodospirillaceae bacterium]
MPIRVRTALAARIARIDHQRYNEAVADDLYPCAPLTMKGSSRIFDSDDLLGLFIYGRLTTMGLPPRHAGRLACEAKGTLERNSEEERIVYVRSEADLHAMIPGSQYDPDHEKKGRGYRGLGRIVFTIEFYVDTIRDIIAKAIEDEQSILGEED